MTYKPPVVTDNSATAGQSFSVERRVGRVIEARVFSLKTVDDATAYSLALASVVAQVPADLRPVLCADHRPVAIYSQPVSDRLTELFLQMNPRLERIGILVAPTNATLTLQLSRITRDAQYAERRVFQTGTDAISFLGPVLDPTESERLRDFVAEFIPHRAG
jgi:hypothetical protein